MNDRAKLTGNRIDPDDIGYNESANPSFEAILAARLSRRNFMLGSAGTGAMAVFGGVSLGALAGCNSDSTGVAAAPAATTSTETLLSFTAVSKSLADAVSIPDGYRFSVLCALGDPLAAGVSAYGNLGNDTDYENRFGDHHDGMDYFGLSASGTPDPASSERALIAMNHEATTDETRSSFFLHADGGTPTLPRPAAEVDKETAIHGISVFEIGKTGGTFAYVHDSAFNFRIHQNTPVEIHGPASGNALLVTKYSSTGTATRGTLNNCGTGKTPWGTLVSGEENWAGYFTRNATDDTARTNANYAKSVTSLNRYGRKQGAASRHGWESVVTGEDKYRRWDISLTGADASTDYRNELNTFGYIVEIDPYDKSLVARKRTALGRFAHEAASFSIPVEGRPLAVYQGDDSKGEYIYKFVSTKNWVAADATRVDRLTVGSEYLDDGKLFAARFNADGSGEWIELSISNAAIASYAAYPFADQADVLVNARLAADAVGATKMDRPEWSAVNPANGEIYFTLTNNSSRTTATADAANPRVYSDVKGTSTVNTGNVNGHIIRVRESGSDVAATTFTWDVYLFGAESGAGSAINLSGLTTDQDFSSPDGLAFSKATGICWIQTDDGAYTDVTNCMMLAALPGQVGDGDTVTVSGTGVATYRGKLPTADTLKRFLVGPKACEITGLCESPDGRALFVNIQHPGETTLMTDVAAGNTSAYTSHWPGNTGYGAGGDAARPRSATIVITKNDGGRIGS